MPVTLTGVLLLLLGPIAAAQSPGLDAVSAGDLARWEGDRPAAREAWRQAVASGEPEAEVMARLRLLGVSGNLGSLVHGPKIDEALTEVEGAWGWIAVADFHLLAPPPIGGDQEAAVDAAHEALATLPGPAAARLYLATRDPAWLEALRVATDRDGLGEALVAHDGDPAPDPGTWTLGVGAAGAPGAGVGGAVVFMHPDLATRGWQLNLHAAGTTRGTFDLGVSGRTPTRAGVYGHFGASGGRTESDIYLSDGSRLSTVLWHTSARAGPGWSWRDLKVWGGVVARWDRVPSTLMYDTCRLATVDCPPTSTLAGHGGYGGITWDAATGWGADRRGWRATVSLGGAMPGLADYRHLSWRAEAAGYVGLAGGVLAGRLLWRQELAEQAPLFRLPTAGGPDVHRGAWAGRYRADRIAALDVEQRWVLRGPWEGVIFFSGAWVPDDTLIAGLHPGAGAGIRVILPPEEWNVVRLDVAVSDSGWGIYAGWGETF